MSAEAHSPEKVASYQVRLVNPRLGQDVTLTVPANEYILDIAEKQGLSIPSHCRIGCCSTCVSILDTGEVNQGDQCYLDDPDLEANFVLICCAFPKADCTLQTHQQQALQHFRAQPSKIPRPV